MTPSTVPSVALVLGLSLSTLFGATACSKANADASQSADAPAPVAATPAKAPAVGDTVVARWGGTSFYEGKLQSFDGRQGKVAWADGNNASDVLVNGIFAIPATGSVPNAKVGQYVLVKKSTGTYWSCAQIASLGDGIVSVKYPLDGTTGSVEPDHVITISPVLAAEIDVEAKRADFLRQARAAGAPPRPEGWAPKKGEPIFALFAGSTWYPSKVLSVTGDKIKVAWGDNSTPSDRTLKEVAPDTKVGQGASVGKFVIVRPSYNGGWLYGRVTALAGDSITADMQDGTSKTIAAKDYLTLQ